MMLLPRSKSYDTLHEIQSRLAANFVSESVHLSKHRNENLGKRFKMTYVAGKDGRLDLQSLEVFSEWKEIP